jgi:CheY-like chemotaxis protein
MLPGTLDGFDSITGAPPDCALLDYGTASGDGIERMRRARERWPGVPLVVLTGAIAKGIAVPPVAPPSIAEREQGRCLALVVAAVGEMLA